jgi:autotransporter strand-loop-strand O-heptosyltransferase
MAHPQQQEFCKRISTIFPQYFNGKKVLDIGSLDINGNNRFLLSGNYNYIGLDVGSGNNVDVIQVAHLYDAPNEQFDLIISTEVFEHDMFYERSIQNIIRMLKPGGAFIFTCASTGRPEHGTRKSDGSWAAPLLAEISEEWSDYYKNLTEEDIHQVKGFDEAFPDGMFEYSAYPGDLYFFGVKGGIQNSIKYSTFNGQSLIKPNEYPNDIFVVDTWPNTPEKETDLVECIKKLREFAGIPILLVSHYAIKPEIQKLVDYYLYDKENPLLLNSEFEEYSVASGRWSSTGNARIDTEMEYHHDYAIWRSMTHAFNFCKYLGKKTIHFMEYDNLIDTFQYRQAFLERASNHDAVIYEYHEGSAKDTHLAKFMATFIFSIKTDIALNIINEVKSKIEYFTNRPNGWQLERVFLHYLEKHAKDIWVTNYIANSNELNTQAVWNRDGILRDDAKFQIYTAADDFENLYLHLVSGFHDEPATKDYLLEIKYNGNSQFKTLKKGEFIMLNLGEYRKGYTVIVNYLGKRAFTQFLSDDYLTFVKMNHVTIDGVNEVPTINHNLVDGPLIEIVSKSPMKYRVNFIDDKDDRLVYSTTLKGGTWAKSSIKYFKQWKIEIKDQFGQIVSEFVTDLADRRVYISLESRALGDNLAWFPYVEEFRKKHKCTVICSTFWNGLFKDQYPAIEFVEPGQMVPNLHAMYKIGWFHNGNNVDSTRNPSDFKLSPLQKTASDILGLEYKEIKPRLNCPTGPVLKKKVGFGIHGTAQAKYWNNPTGWQEVTDWLIENGYEPVILSREESGYMGNHHPTGAAKLESGSIDQVITELAECSAFIGISSGLTWLAWATNTPTIQISGFTDPYNEPDNGIFKLAAPDGACSGCANRLRLDAGDWNWCPDQKGTPRQFECSKLITADQVIEKLKQILI